jgi:hypothetical protein
MGIGSGGVCLYLSYLGNRQKDHKFEASPGKVRKIISQRQNINKRAMSVTQVVKCSVDALGSIPNTGEKKKNRSGI